MQRPAARHDLLGVRIHPRHQLCAGAFARGADHQDMVALAHQITVGSLVVWEVGASEPVCDVLNVMHGDGWLAEWLGGLFACLCCRCLIADYKRLAAACCCSWCCCSHTAAAAAAVNRFKQALTETSALSALAGSSSSGVRFPGSCM